jgi:hypothetical protein
MQKRVRAVSAVAVLATTMLAAGPTGSDFAAAPPLATKTSKAVVPTVVAHMGKSTIRLSTGHRIHAGRVIFKVVARTGGHPLQLLRLHEGYTWRQAQQDIDAAFRGDLDAIRRVDHKISFLGGSSARSGKPGRFAVNLRKARLILVDEEHPSMTRLRVFGTAPPRPRVRTASHITTFTYGFGTSRSPLPASGWTNVGNVSDQPHFVIFQRVKDSTTHRQVRRFLATHPHHNPPWGLKAFASTGLLSPNRHEIFQYHLPAGKYLLLCNWPDDETGMPHLFMGMWTLVRLR